MLWKESCGAHFSPSHPGALPAWCPGLVLEHRGEHLSVCLLFLLPNFFPLASTPPFLVHARVYWGKLQHWLYAVLLVDAESSLHFISAIHILFFYITLIIIYKILFFERFIFKNIFYSMMSLVYLLNENLYFYSNKLHSSYHSEQYPFHVGPISIRNLFIHSIFTYLDWSFFSFLFL